MNADERREQVLAAATRAFARTGYAGTSTDVVAREAGVSQPYVVRMFGTKRDAVPRGVRAGHPTGSRTAFEAVLDAGEPFDPEDEDDWARLGDGVHRAARRPRLPAGDDARLRRRRRRRDRRARPAAAWATIYDVILRHRLHPERATDFVAHGMLLNVMLAMRAPEHLGESGALADMTACAFGSEGLDVVAAASDHVGETPGTDGDTRV